MKTEKTISVSKTLAFSLAIALNAGMSTLPAKADIPVPGEPGASRAYGSSASARAKDDAVLTGQVATDIVPAQRLLAKGKYSEAEELFRELLVNNPQDLAATVGLGTALAKQFKLDSADEMFDRVLMQNPTNALAFAGKATVIINRLQSSSETIRKNRESYLRQAESYARQAVRLAPAEAESHYVLGRVYQEQHIMGDAASELRTAIQLDPNHSFAYSALGKVALKENSVAEAAENFKRAIELNSGNSSAHFGLGSAYLKLGQVDEAIKEFNTSLYQFPNSWPVHMELGQAYQQQGNTVAALKEYRQSIMIKPENAQPYLKIAEIRENKGDLELALAQLRDGLSQMPYNIELRQHIAALCLKLDKADDAIKAYQTILKMGPNDNVAIKGLSKALYLKAQKEAAGAMLASNDYESALSSLDKAIALSPNDMELRLAKAKLMSLSGTTPDITKLGEPKNEGEKLAAAEALMAAGDFEKASSYMTEVVNSVDDAKQSFAVADVAVLVKDLDNAEAAYKKALSLKGSPQRVDRGLAAITKLRNDSIEDVRVGKELFDKRQFDGAIERFRHAISENPRLADARVGLAQALEKKKDPTSVVLAEAAVQYKNYLSLKPNIPSKDIEKYERQISKLQEKAAREAKKENRQG